MVSRSMMGACGSALVIGLLVAGCTPDPGPGPGTSPSPAVSSSTPSPTPTENAQERQQRLDFEAAEKAYLTAFAESGRLAMAGGTNKPTKVLLENTVGAYLDVQTKRSEGLEAERLARRQALDDIRVCQSAVGAPKS